MCTLETLSTIHYTTSHPSIYLSWRRRLVGAREISATKSCSAVSVACPRAGEYHRQRGLAPPMKLTKKYREQHKQRTHAPNFARSVCVYVFLCICGTHACARGSIGWVRRARPPELMAKLSGRERNAVIYCPPRPRPGRAQRAPSLSKMCVCVRPERVRCASSDMLADVAHYICIVVWMLSIHSGGQILRNDRA